MRAPHRVRGVAGTAAGIDLCLHLVSCDHGVDAATTVARRLVLPLSRSGGQAQYVDSPVAPETTDRVNELVEWADHDSRTASRSTTSPATAP